jgi:hypothetical protein
VLWAAASQAEDTAVEKLMTLLAPSLDDQNLSMGHG